MPQEPSEAASLSERYGVPAIINARGTVTRLGGAPMSAGVVEAMREASRCVVALEDLHGAACRFLAPRCGTEAALVTCGASAGLMLGAAAILAGWDPGRMERLPDTRSMPHEFLVARSHRNGYDHAVRAAGAKLVEVGLDEATSGAGVRPVEPWEFDVAISDQTVGVLYVLDEHSQPPLADVVRVAHAHQLPVLVDAAAQLPPVHNLQQISDSGADLIVFSGGKALGGPQATGILCGRRDLVGSAYLQMMDLDEHPEHWSPPGELVVRGRLPGIPRHGIGRMLKVSKEQIFGLLRAVEEFTEGQQQARSEERRRWLREMAQQLATAGVTAEVVERVKPRLEIHLQDPDAPRLAMAICQRLQKGQPPIYVGHARLKQGVLVVDPACLLKEQLPILTSQLAAAITASR